MILVVGNPEFTHTWDTVKVIRPVIIEDDKRAGILQAMINAVEAMNLGDVVCQNDVYFTEDPGKATPAFGTVRTFVKPVSAVHCCPQAFAIYDEPTRRAVLDAWKNEKGWACTAWREIPKTADWVIAVHQGGTV